MRETKDKNAMREKFWNLGGTRMGNVVGITKEDEKEGKADDEEDSKPPTVNADGEIDYKKSTGHAGCAAHAKRKEKKELMNNGCTT